MNTAVRPSSYLARETLVSATINAVIGVAFFLLVLGAVDPIPIWGLGNYAFDFVPQSFAIGLMATLVPGLLCRKAIAQGRISGLRAAPAEPGSVLARGVLNAMIAALGGAGLCAVVIWMTGTDALPHTPAFILKVLYGAMMGSLVTCFTLQRMLD